MSIAEDLKNTSRPSSSASPPSSPTDHDIVSAVNRLTTAVSELRSSLPNMVWLEVRSAMEDQRSTSQPSAITPRRLDGVESRLSEIEKTLAEFHHSLDGENFRSAARTLIEETNRSRTSVTSVVEQSTEQVAESTRLVKHAHGAAGVVAQQAEASIKAISASAVGAVTDKVTTRVDDLEERLDRICKKIESRQLWTAAGAMALTLLPAATVALSGIILVAGIVFGWEIAVTTEAATWLRWVRGIGAVLGTGCALVGLAWLVRWVAGYVSTWARVPPGGLRRWR